MRPEGNKYIVSVSACANGESVKKAASVEAADNEKYVKVDVVRGDGERWAATPSTKKGSVTARTLTHKQYKMKRNENGTRWRIPRYELNDLRFR